MKLRRPTLSLFSRLFLSYSLTSVVPLALVWLVMVIAGQDIVTGYLRQAGGRTIDAATASATELLGTYGRMAEEIAGQPAVVEVMKQRASTMSPDEELRLFDAVYATLAGSLGLVEVHISDWTGDFRVSTSLYPARYDMRRNLTRRDFHTGETDSAQWLQVDPGPGTGGEQIVLALWRPTEWGVVIVEVREAAFRRIAAMRAASRKFLVDRHSYRVFGLSQPREESTFTRHPALGIAFTDETFQTPERSLVVHRQDIPGSPLSWVMITDLGPLLETLRVLLLAGLAVMGGAILITMMAAFRMSRSISAPIHAVVEAMIRDPGGPLPLPAVAPRRQADELQQLTTQYNRMVETIDDLFTAVRREEQAHRTAERRALEAQIQPHFLYNTLGSIKSMAKLGDTAAVVDMVTDLGKILRFLLDDTTPVVTVRESLEQIRRYLNIQQVRFQDRLKVSIVMDDDAGSVAIPKLLVQPLVENAIRHGVERSTLPVDITVEARCNRDARTLEIVVCDTGPADNAPAQPGFGLGLQNVRERLNLMYNGSARMDLVRSGEVTTARIEVPLP